MGEKTIKAGTDLVKILVDNGKGSEAILGKVSDLFPAILFIYNTYDQKVTFLNNKITSQLGYSIPDLSNINNLFQLISDKDRLSVEEIISHFQNQENSDSISFNCNLINNNGTLTFYKFEGNVVDKNEQNKPQNILFTANPLETQEECNEDLLNFKSLMHENENLLKYGTWEYDFATKTIHWSDGMYLLFGYDPAKDRERLKVDEDIYFKHMDPTQVKTMLDKRKMFFENNINEYTWEYEIFTNDRKDQKRIESYSRLVRDDLGNPTQIIGTSRDITRLREYERSLEEKVKDLDRSNKELEEFAYIASHDLQEPLRKLTTFSERLQQKFSDRLDDDGNAYIDRMLNATSNMRMLIDNLLEYSRTTSSAATAEKCSLNTVVKKALSDLELLIEETRTKVEVGELPKIECIPGQFSQLFINIIGNAIKFRIPDKQPLIKIQSRHLTPKEISYHLLDESRIWHRITISDNGIGFEEEYSRKIFQIFQRLHSKAEYPGTGIGLSICKKIVDHHKGVIYAEGKPMQGATFTIILPETQ